ncbi:MAG: sulfotransferase, partial [Gemmatimonadota bacterium]|nr:sulfotransferase [Gemmatimonadota bacterium]
MPGLKDLLRRLVKTPLEARVGRLDVRLEHQRHVASIPGIGQAIATMRARWPGLEGDAPADDPVFLLSAGWRSGSTLLQRLVMSDSRILMWGEPYANCDLLGHLASSLRIFRADYPTDDWFVERGLAGGREGLSEQWIANLYPEARDLIGAHRELFRTLYGEPARRHGYQRWGLKEVRYGIEHARYLRFLFPNARFLFLYRSPYDSWRSYRIWRNWYYRWPDQPIYTAGAFGALWRELVEGFL